jgi:hypothetical protein
LRRKSGGVVSLSEKRNVKLKKKRKEVKIP